MQLDTRQIVIQMTAWKTNAVPSPADFCRVKEETASEQPTSASEQPVRQFDSSLVEFGDGE